MIHRRIIIMAVLISGLFLASCGGKKRYAALQMQHQDLTERYQQSQMQLAESRTNVKNLEEQLATERKNNPSLREALKRLQGTLDMNINQNTQGNVNISKLVDEINDSNRYIQHLVNTKNKSDSLNLVLTNNLTRSLSREELRGVYVKVLKGVV